MYYSVASLKSCAKVREEGFKAFFKGSLARIIRSSPQYGGALAAYEYLQKVCVRCYIMALPSFHRTILFASQLLAPRAEHGRSH